MSLRNADARVLEQFLRTMAPPAVLTTTYRQRVLRESLTIREQVIQTRRKQRLLAGLTLVGCCLTLPVYALMIAISSWVVPSLEATAITLTKPPAASSFQATIDGFELAAIQAQVQARAVGWFEAHRSGEK